MDVHTSEAITIVAMIGLIAFVIWLIFRRFQSAAQLRLRRIETFHRLLDRFQTTDELVAFLEGDVGRRLLDEPGPAAERPTSSLARYAGAGVLLGALGIALWINASRLALRITASSDMNEVRNLAEMQSWATIVVAIAAALILIAIAGYLIVRRTGPVRSFIDHSTAR